VHASQKRRSGDDLVFDPLSTRLSVTTILSGGIDGAWIMPSGRFEFGAGVVASGTVGGDFETFFLAPSVSARVNSDPLGPNENVVLYAGGFLGFTSVFISAPGFSDSETIFSVGPRIGVELYLTPTVAVQLREEFTIYGGSDLTGDFQNRLSIGFRFLLN